MAATTDVLTPFLLSPAILLSLPHTSLLCPGRSSMRHRRASVRRGGARCTDNDPQAGGTDLNYLSLVARPSSAGGRRSAMVGSSASGRRPAMRGAPPVAARARAWWLPRVARARPRGSRWRLVRAGASPGWHPAAPAAGRVMSRWWIGLQCAGQLGRRRRWTGA
jgi:hypothetical protein